MKELQAQKNSCHTAILCVEHTEKKKKMKLMLFLLLWLSLLTFPAL